MREDGKLGYCCLGVACDVLKNHPDIKSDWNDDQFLGYSGLLPPELQKLLGISCFGMFSSSPEHKADLVEMNDEGSSFNEIANTIEDPKNQWL